MNRLLTLVVFLLSPALVSASGYPALHDVIDVASNDVLNVRQTPEPGSDIIGTLKFDAQGIEVVQQSENERWGRINVGETSGWVSLRYLARRSDNPDYALAQSLECYGTEPFWSADIVQGQSVEFKSMETPLISYGAGLVNGSRSYTNRFVMRFGNENYSLFRKAECSDGMSDRVYGLQIDMIINEGGDVMLLSGCCSILAH